MPQLLTSDTARDLVDYLDAGDVLECYLLTRQTFLHYYFGSSRSTVTDSSDNSTTSTTTDSTSSSNPVSPGRQHNMIPIQTTSLGLRYRPPPGGTKPALDLTLEYGPNREGRENLHLSVPLMLESDESFGDDASWKPIRVTWANEGHVYFTTEISQESYIAANYMASLTGAVLSDLLTTASLYPVLHRRYQPWQVVSKNDDEDTKQQESNNNNKNNGGGVDNKRVLLRSSSDYDFVHSLFEHLASVGVELSPVLNPFFYRLRLNAVRIQRRTFTSDGQKDMATFYQNFYTCLQSLATAAVLPPLPTPKPSNQPTMSPAPTDAPSTRGTEESSNQTSKTSDDTSSYSDRPSASPLAATKTMPLKQQHSSGDERPRAPTAFPNMVRSKTAPPQTDSEEGGNDMSNAPTVASSIAPTQPPHETRWMLENLRQDVSIPESDNLTSTTPSMTPMTTQPETNEESKTEESAAQQQTIEPMDAGVSMTPWPSAMPSFAPSIVPTLLPSVSKESAVMPPSPISHVHVAAEAAAAAQQAADAVDDNPEEAAAALKQAATAAQKAATATAQQQASLRQEALFSGNGASMAQTVSLCLSDPLYGIAAKGKNSTTIYLYRDSTYYYTVDVVAPYIEVFPFPAPVPKPPPEPLVPQGSLVDWLLALVLIVFCLLSVILILQHVLGRNFKIVPSLYKFQRWFFDPRNVAYADLQHTDEAKQLGAGNAYTFGQDAIPRSMGGVRVVPSKDGQGFHSIDGKLHVASALDEFADDKTDPLGGCGRFVIDDDGIGDVELSARPGATKTFSAGGGSSFNDDDIDLASLDSAGLRFLRDPELVDLPDLKSKSKVAVPVSLIGQTSAHSSEGSG